MKTFSDWTVEGLTAEARAHRLLVQQARSEAIRYLGISKKASGKIRDRLKRQGFAPDVIDAVLAEFKAEGRCDDVLLARALLRQRRGRQAEARRALRQRMQAAGLEAGAVEAVLLEAPSDLELAADLLASRFSEEWADLEAGRQAGQVDRDGFVRLVRFFSRRGFSDAVIGRLLQPPDLNR